ncbi:MAG TPA: hypothetical protein RMH99_16910 [Sandaracinaceae bacterium LLY-WYZ-13_1]|nr:hypothetical protein [Sandaracinaceae bacterium LLY-WYZ-13_1]
MSRGIAIAAGVAVVLLALPAVLVTAWVSSAEGRLAEMEAAELTDDAPEVAVARAANEAYCTPELQQILRRVLLSCGLIGGAGGRGCQPVEARNVATMDDADFNALFVPMQERGGIVQYEQGSAELEEADEALIDRVFADRRGASYFFVVSRASPEGSTETNRELSRQRAEAVMTHLEETFADPELEREVGLLWLGEEYAQLDPSFCDWNRSGGADACATEDLNRSAFIAWIDCRL